LRSAKVVKSNNFNQGDAKIGLIVVMCFANRY
jgi:hypothetical protein